MGFQHEPLSLYVRRRRDIVSRSVSIFRGWNYHDIEVPLLDYVEPDTDAQGPRTFQIVDREGTAMALRSDGTPAIAKLYARHLHRWPAPLRVCYANRIVRSERALGREQTESYQLGVEMLGSNGVLSDLEVILICLETLEAIGVRDHQLNLSSSAIYHHLLRKTGLPAIKRDAINAAVRVRDPYEVRQILHRCGTRHNIAQALEAVASLWGGERQLRVISQELPNDRTLAGAIKHLERLVQILGELGYGEHLNIDLGDLPDQDYYTGTVFSVVSEGVGRRLGGGGRYDDLCSRFGVAAPAAGFALRLDALIATLQASASLAPLSSPVSVVRVDPEDPVPGLKELLSHRRANQNTRLIVGNGRPPMPGASGKESP